jgi:hypothetical protein
MRAWDSQLARCTVAITASIVIAACETSAPVATRARGVRSDFTADPASEWSEPVNLGAPINSPGADQSPALSADGLSLYFASDRPGGFGGVDVWVAHRVTSEGPWDTPVNLGTTINSADAETGPSLSLDGHLLFFASNRAGGEGNFDIYVSHRADANDDLGWSEPVNVGAGVNSSTGEFGPWYSGDDADGPVLYSDLLGANQPGRTIERLGCSHRRDREPELHAGAPHAPGEWSADGILLDPPRRTGRRRSVDSHTPHP